MGDSWLSHLLTGFLAFLGGSLLPFLTDSRRQRSVDAQLAALHAQNMEQGRQINVLHADHIKCVEQHALLQGKVEVLEKKV